MSKEFAIVGHGDWMFNSGLGDEIDSFDRVMRFPFYSYQRRILVDRKKNWGTKTTDLCVSSQTIPAMIQDGVIPEEATWIWTRPGLWNPKYIYQNEKFKTRRAQGAINQWQIAFQRKGPTGYADSSGKKFIFSRGTAAVVIACHYIKPRTLTLYGYQNVMRGYSERYTVHDWHKERELIKEVAEFYKVKIETDREST